MDDEAIAAVRSALGELNRALFALSARGIEAEIRTLAHQSITDPVATTVVTARLKRTKTEIDVHL